MLGASISAAIIGGPDFRSFSDVWVKWFEGSLIGTLSLLPMLLYVAHHGLREAWARLAQKEAIVLMLGAVAVALVVTTTLPFPLVYIPIPLAYSAVRKGFVVTAAATFLVSLCVGGLIAGGVLAPPPTGQAWVEGLFYLAFLMSLLPAMLLAAAIERNTNSLRELQRASTRAARASQAKSEFLANMSHEIRTPLSAITGLADLISRDGKDEAQRRRAWQLGVAARSLTSVVGDILDFSRIEAGHLQLETAPFRLDLLLQEVHAVLQASKPLGDTDLRLELDPALPVHLVGDEFRLRQVLMNLVGNALKFTPQGQVRLAIRTVALQDDAAIVEFTVSDDGIGIAADQLDSIFEAFTQADPSISRRFGGSGLGLPISQRLIQLMGGHITVESDPGKGSIFRFQLRLPLPAGIPQAAETQGSSRPRLAGLRILVVDDNDLGRSVIVELLRNEGAQTQEAASGMAALRALEVNTPPDAILMDVHMPGMDGRAATHRIRQLPGMASLPIVALTADVFPATREACLAVGMNAHLGKPVSVDALVALLHALCRPGAAPIGDTQDGKASPATRDTAFDFDASLRRLGGNRELFVRSARRFGEIYGSMPEQIAAQLTANDISQAAEMLHALKGVAATLGAVALSACAERQRQQLIAEDPDSSAIASMHDELAGLVRTTRAALEATANDMESRSNGNHAH